MWFNYLINFIKYIGYYNRSLKKKNEFFFFNNIFNIVNY